MIAVFPSGLTNLPGALTDTLCVVFLTERRGLKAVSVAYCGNEHNAADGVMQLSDRLLDGAIVSPPNDPSKRFGICTGCKNKVKATAP